KTTQFLLEVDSRLHSAFESPSAVALSAELTRHMPVSHHDVGVHEKSGPDPVEIGVSRNFDSSHSLNDLVDIWAMFIQDLPLSGWLHKAAILNQNGGSAFQMDNCFQSEAFFGSNLLFPALFDFNQSSSSSIEQELSFLLDRTLDRPFLCRPPSSWPGSQVLGQIGLYNLIQARKNSPR